MNQLFGYGVVFVIQKTAYLFAAWLVVVMANGRNR